MAVQRDNEISITLFQVYNSLNYGLYTNIVRFRLFLQVTPSHPALIDTSSAVKWFRECHNSSQRAWKLLIIFHYFYMPHPSTPSSGVLGVQLNSISNITIRHSDSKNYAFLTNFGRFRLSLNATLPNLHSGILENHVSYQ